MPTIPEKFEKEFGASAARAVATMNLKDWELILLSRIMAVGSAEVLSSEQWAARAQNYVTVMRGDDPSIVALTVEELRDLELDYRLLLDISFARRLFRTVYSIINFGQIDLAGLLREKLEKVSEDRLEFENLPDDGQRDFYRVVYLELALEFIDSTPEKVQLFLLSSDLLFLALRLDFDLEDVFHNYLSGYINFDRRVDLSIDYATVLAANENFLGEYAGAPVTLNRWMELFRAYSQESLDPVALMKFLEDDEYAGKCTEMEKKIIRSAVQLYTRLISMTLAVPDRDLDAVEREARRLAERNNMSSGPNWQYLINSPAIDELSRRDIEQYLRDQFDASILRAKIIGVIEKMGDWDQGAKLENILTISGLYEQRFVGRAEPLVVFDEKSGKFILLK